MEHYTLPRPREPEGAERTWEPPYIYTKILTYNTQAMSAATCFFRSGSTSEANQGFFFIHIWLRGEGWTSGKYVGR